MHQRLLVILILSLTTSTARGQTPPAPDQTETAKALLERIERLEKRVAELEAKQAAAPVAAVATSNVSTAQKAEPEAGAAKAEPTHPMETRVDQAAVGQVETHYPSLQFRGFADMDFSATDQKGTTSGLNLGQLDLHLASPLSQKISYFGELTFNAHPTGYTVEVERSIIRYDYNDYFKISFGRYHTPIGYWNTAYHHGAWLQTTMSRNLEVAVADSMSREGASGSDRSASWCQTAASGSASASVTPPITASSPPGSAPQGWSRSCGA